VRPDLGKCFLQANRKGRGGGSNNLKEKPELQFEKKMRGAGRCTKGRPGVKLGKLDCAVGGGKVGRLATTGRRALQLLGF